MSYKELKSLYYEKRETYAQEYWNRFHSEEAVRIDFMIGGNQAFFLQNAEVMRLAYEIAKLDKTIGRQCRDLPGVALDQYTKKCLIDEIVLTNKIEGVHSSRKEIGEVLDTLELQSQTKGKRSRFLGLVKKYFKLNHGETVPLTTCRDIRDIYDEVFLEEVLHENPGNRPDGQLFRKGSVSVHSETDREIHRGLMPESRIIEAMEQALAFLNDEGTEELFRVCLFHYFMEYIHPFYDGNGRLGRFVFSYGISRTLSPLIAFRLSETIKENIRVYYKAFQVCNDPHNLGDLTPFLLMQLSMILAAMKELEISLEQRQKTWGKYERAIRKYFQGSEREVLRLYSYLIQAALFSEKGISMQELEHHMKCSVYLIKKKMAEIPAQWIVTQKKGNCKFYSLNLEQLDAKILQEDLQKIEKPE